jgi:hypothetical protein
VTSPAELVEPLRTLTGTLRGEIRYGDAKAPRTNDQLLQLVFQRNAELERRFRGLLIKIKHDAKEVVVLVGSPAGDAWLEDASWTPEFVDKKWYQSNPPHPAEFTLDPSMAPGRVTK